MLAADRVGIAPLEAAIRTLVRLSSLAGRRRAQFDEHAVDVADKSERLPPGFGVGLGDEDGVAAKA
jgi:hypothetical protein